MVAISYVEASPETVGVLDIPHDELDQFALSPEDLPYANLYGVIGAKLGDQIIQTYEPHGRRVLLTSHADASDPSVEVRSVLTMETEVPYQGGTAFCIAVQKGVTYVRLHEYSRHGDRERTKNHRPLDEQGRLKLSRLLGMVHGDIVPVEDQVTS